MTEILTHMIDLFILLAIYPAEMVRLPIPRHNDSSGPRFHFALDKPTQRHNGAEF